MSEALNILITSVGRRSYMVDYFKRALRGRGQVHAANSVMTYAMQVADHSVVTPLIYDGSYIDEVLCYCRDHNISAVLSLLDIDLPVLAAHRERFREIGVTLLVSDLEVTRICNDKWRTFEFLRSHGIAAPATFRTLADCRRALASGEVCFPLVVKPRWGLASIGLFHAENGKELEVLYEKSQAETTRGYLQYESSQDPGQTVIIQEKLQGEEYGLDVLNDLDGGLLACVAKRKVAMRAGETDAAQIVTEPGLRQLGRQLSECLRHIANLDVDCFRSGESFTVLELNCHFGGQYPFAHLAGADFPGAIVAMLRGEPVPAEMLAAKAGTLGYKDLRPVVMTD